MLLLFRWGMYVESRNGYEKIKWLPYKWDYFDVKTDVKRVSFYLIIEKIWGLGFEEYDYTFRNYILTGWSLFWFQYKLFSQFDHKRHLEHLVPLRSMLNLLLGDSIKSNLILGIWDLQVTLVADTYTYTFDFYTFKNLHFYKLYFIFFDICFILSH